LSVLQEAKCEDVRKEITAGLREVCKRFDMTRYTVQSKDRTQAVYCDMASGKCYVRDHDNAEGLELFETTDKDEAHSMYLMCGGGYSDMEKVEEG
jgi:hypothetical protein